MRTNEKTTPRCPICNQMRQMDFARNKIFEVTACEKCRTEFSATHGRIKKIEAKALRRLRNPNPPHTA